MKISAGCSVSLFPILASVGFASSPIPRDDILSRALGPTPLQSDLQELTDDIGGRPTGSPALERAIEWSRRKFEDAGLDNVHTESYVIRSLWAPGGESGETTVPYRSTLRVAALPFSAATGPGGLEAEVIDMHLGTPADFASVGGRLRGRWALISNEAKPGFHELLLVPPIFLAAREAGAVGVLWSGTHEGRLLYRNPVRINGTIDPLSAAMIAREDALRIGRLLARGLTVRVRIVTTPQVSNNAQSANVVAEVRGHERPDEVVILGAHLDSWDLGRGALDNGCNVALVIDAARQIAAAAKIHPPRRTVRFVLFTGEEAGFLGSLANVREHRAELDRTVAMITLDDGDGRITCFSLGGRTDSATAAASALKAVEAFGPFEQTSDAFVGTDNVDYLLEGVPTFVANQLPASYRANYHAESDTFDKVEPRELKINTAIAATFTWSLADAAARPGPRLKRPQIEEMARATGLDEQLKTFKLWESFVSGARGRAP